MFCIEDAYSRRGEKKTAARKSKNLYPPECQEITQESGHDQTRIFDASPPCLFFYQIKKISL